METESLSDRGKEKKNWSSVCLIPRPPLTFVLHSGHMKQIQDWLWHCARGKKEVQAEKWPENVHCQGWISIACANSAVKNSILASSVKRTVCYSPSLPSFKLQIYKFKNRNSLENQRVWIQIGKIEGPFHMMKGFNVRNEREAGAVREDPPRVLASHRGCWFSRAGWSVCTAQEHLGISYWCSLSAAATCAWFSRSSFGLRFKH